MTLIKRSLTGRIPTNEAYAYLEVNVAGETENSESFYQEALPEIETLFAKYGNKPLAVKTEGVWEKKTTFTNEEIYYDTINHKYKSLDGNELISATTYKKKFEKPFDMLKISEMVSKKYGVAPEIIRDMWEKNSKISTTFGSAIHYAMEQYWLHRGHGCEDKEYYLPKHPLLRNAVTSFPEKDRENVFPELFVSNVKKGMVGQIDGLYKTNEIGTVDVEKGIIFDYKTDHDLKPDKLKLHFIQLSFYADILKAFGWTIEGLEIWNFTDSWKVFESPVLDLEELEANLKK